MRLKNIERTPFHAMRYWTSGSKGTPRLRELPFFRATAEGLPESIQSLILVSDLQGREYVSRSLRGKERLLGEAVADELAKLKEEKALPEISAVLMCGDLYDYPDCRKTGGSGNVAPVFHAFATTAKEVVGVLGNHDLLAPTEQFPTNVTLLDGEEVVISGLRVGGISGIIGDPKRHNRRSEDQFLQVLESVTQQCPDILLLHQGPEDSQRGQLGDPAITLSLETGFSGLTVFGHTHWPDHFCIDLGDGQAVNVDARILIVEPAIDDYHNRQNP